MNPVHSFGLRTSDRVNDPPPGARRPGGHVRRQPKARAGLVAGLVLAAAACAAEAGGVSVLTYHNDNARTGQNPNETALTLANVNTNSFGKLFSYAVDGYVYAQPLVLANVAIPSQGTHNVVYVATEHDSVYAFDADSNEGSNAAPLWQVSFINPAAGITPVSYWDVSGCSAIVPELGITSTPVIDPASGTLYVVAETKEVVGGATNFVYRLHALDVATGAETFGGPVVLQASVAGTGDGTDGAGRVPFVPVQHLSRPGLLLINGLVLIAFGSNCDTPPYHGWLLAYDARTLTQTGVYNTTPNGSDGAIWQSGGGPAGDALGNVYFLTGNGTFDAAHNNLGDSFVKLSTTNGLALADYFTPSDQAALETYDVDLGSGGAVVLPDAVGNANHPHLLVGAGKEGTIYLLDRDNLGQFNPEADTQIAGEVSGAIGQCFATPAYFNSTLYYCGMDDVMKAFTLSDGVLQATPASQGATPFVELGATPSVSADGTNNAIVWAIQADGYYEGGPAILRAYNATNLAQELYGSSQAGTRDAPGAPVKFSVPTVANGKVYVGAQYAVAVFGNGTFVATPTLAPEVGAFGRTVTVTLADTTPGASIYYTLDGTEPTTASLLYTQPVVLASSATLSAKAFAAGAVASAVASATYTIALDGTGTGLTGAYYANQSSTLTDPPTLTRTDPTVDFDWGAYPPDPSLGSGPFAVRWTGTVQPQFNETYTFYVSAEDGVRLWVSGQLLVDQWADQPLTEWSGSIALVAGQQHLLKLEHYHQTGDAAAHLSWSSPSTGKTVIPSNQLYPIYRQPPQFLANSSTNGPPRLQALALVGTSYVLQATTDLKNWIPLSTNVASSTLLNFTDPDAAHYPYRFYRIVQQP